VGYSFGRVTGLINLLLIFTMKRIALLLVLVIGLAAASAARSQQPTNAPAAKPSTTVSDTVSLKPSPELEKALEELAAAVQALALKIASDPQIKTAAMQVASGAVTTAQQVVAEQSVAIQEALKTAAERISAAQTNPHQRPKKQ